MAKLTIESFGHGTQNTRVLVDDEPVGYIQHITFQASANALMPACAVVLYESPDKAKLIEKLRTIPWITIVSIPIPERL